ncbi:YycH family regulatory protein [Virgibacillus dakarensis]|uniref:YycH family regulatory protein n=1 Tax=Virgibacillus dakarensis TaxID=1917889 RepID=UPI000B43A6BE|nr:two-component system activity regulator YycH [Virgibacillus dakarensis]
MKFETVKTFVLVILVGVSLLLTLALWSFKPNLKFLGDMDYAEADIGGQGNLTKKDVVAPKNIIFQINSRYYGFSNPVERQSLYQDMQSWVLYNFKTSEANGPPDDDYQIELLFPDELPMEIADDLFTFDEEPDLPEWSFQRVFITFHPNDSSLEIQFLSTSGDRRASAIVNNSKKYNQLWAYLTKQEGLSEYIQYKESGIPIYVPKNLQEMTERKLTIKNIDPDNLVDALFRNPEIVRRDVTNVGETYYTDSARGMRVKEDGRSIEFVNPLNTNYERMRAFDLLETSMASINEQKGWTGDFNLEELRPSTNFVRFRMYYDGYPVFNSSLAVIEQEWRNQQLYKYQRPLFSYNSPPIGGSSVKLRSGNDVIYFIENASYKAENIDDIQIGYHLVYEEDDLSFYLTLKPAWYINYNGSWQEINFDELSPNKKGG